MNICRICNSSKVTELGSLQAYFDYKTKIFKCSQCLSYYTTRAQEIHESLHSDKASSYSTHTLISNQVKGCFDAGDKESSKQLLSEAAANKFVIDTIEATNEAENIIEFGCSKGQLGAYFIQSGYNYLGVDISTTAVKEATEYFGPHFCHSSSARIENGKPYDAVFHVGTIGCVDKPMEFIEYNLSLLKPKGLLVFNAPNVKSCSVFRDIWVTQTPPPDLISLFYPSFWPQRFSNHANVRIDVLNERTPSALKKIYRKFRYGTMLTYPNHFLYKPNAEPISQPESKPAPINQKSALKRMLIGGLGPLVKPFIPSEFGVHVVMQKL